jgi:hypothetical protein
MGVSAAVAVAVTFVWLGMVLAISFLEAPLKFRAPGVTIPIGLGIGRLVFRALNLAEAVFAVTVLAAAAAGSLPVRAIVLAAVAAALLAGQVGVIRPVLSRRSDRVLAGGDPSRSHAHLWYVTLEAAKVVALAALGASLLAR